MYVMNQNKILKTIGLVVYEIMVPKVFNFVPSKCHMNEQSTTYALLKTGFEKV